MSIVLSVLDEARRFLPKLASAEEERLAGNVGDISIEAEGGASEGPLIEMASWKSLLAVYQCAHLCKRQSCKSTHANSCKSRTLKLRPRHLPTRSTLKTWNCQTISEMRKKNAFEKGYDTGTSFIMKDVLVLSLILSV